MKTIEIGGLMMRRIGTENDTKAQVVVSVQIGTHWIDLMWEPVDGNFCSSISPSAIAEIAAKRRPEFDGPELTWLYRHTEADEAWRLVVIGGDKATAIVAGKVEEMSPLFYVAIAAGVFAIPTEEQIVECRKHPHGAIPVAGSKLADSIDRWNSMLNQRVIASGEYFQLREDAITKEACRKLFPLNVRGV